jgi:SAM-dependent methyltransferase
MLATYKETDMPAPSLFQQEWQVYRKMVEENYLFHREAYACLRAVLAEKAVRAFRFLDIACGDCRSTVAALRGLPVAQYAGIDLSRQALDLAAPALRRLDCPATLVEGDFTAILPAWREPVDVAWIGLSLHHCQEAGKREVMCAVRALLAPAGFLLIYENTSPDGESREAWLDRYRLQRPAWSAYSNAEWDAMWQHVKTFDYPETVSTWHRLATEAGFGIVDEAYVAPSNLFRMFRFA